MDLVFFDTETTGIPDFKSKHGDPSQPHLVQIAATRTDPAGAILDEFCAIVSPRDLYLEMPPAAEAAHGISYSRALSEGVAISIALQRFNRIIRKARLVTHNIGFDKKLVQIAWTRERMWPVGDDPFLGAECTLKLSCSLVNLPPTPKMIAAGRHGPKPPTLTEAHQFFFGETFSGAHDAREDTRACMRVYFAAKAALAKKAADAAS